MQHSAKSKEQCALCLRKVGFGLTRSMRILVVGKATMSRFYKANGILANPLRNGVALKGKGTRRYIGIKAAIRDMRARVRKCLSTKPARIALFYPDGCITLAQQFKWRYDNDIEFRITHLLRRRIRKVIETGVRRGSSIELLGCSTSQFRQHVESQFKDGMSWDNQGRWHLDHRKPCAAFDLTDEEQQRTCFHYTNYQPLWGADNGSKRAWYQGVNYSLKDSEPESLRVLSA